MERTFSMLKPEVVSCGLCGRILSEIEQNGFRICKLRKIRMSKSQAGEFYKSLNTMPFYEELCYYMSSDDVIAMVLEKDNAILDFRELIGTTDPAQARIGTLRKKYAESKSHNAIHGSDSKESAEREINFFAL